MMKYNYKITCDILDLLGITNNNEKNIKRIEYFETLVTDNYRLKNSIIDGL